MIHERPFSRITEHLYVGALAQKYAHSRHFPTWVLSCFVGPALLRFVPALRFASISNCPVPLSSRAASCAVFSPFLLSDSAQTVLRPLCLAGLCRICFPWPTWASRTSSTAPTRSSRARSHPTRSCCATSATTSARPRDPGNPLPHFTRHSGVRIAVLWECVVLASLFAPRFPSFPNCNGLSFSRQPSDDSIVVCYPCLVTGRLRCCGGSSSAPSSCAT